jgi:hypothetical protein
MDIIKVLDAVPVSSTSWRAVCPLCEKNALSIWISPPTPGVGLQCHYNHCNPIAIGFWLQEHGIPFGRDDLIAEAGGKGYQHSETWPEIWTGAIDIQGTHVDDYLMSRYIDINKLSTERLSHLRYIQYFKHPSGKRFPIMLAQLTSGLGHPVGVHRTYLDVTGLRKADVKPNRMTLGLADGAVVRIGEPRSGKIALCEGIETGLAASILLGMPVWACCSAGNLSRISLPDSVNTVSLLHDTDDVGREQAEIAAKTYRAQGKKVYMESPRAGHMSNFGDWNDVLEFIRKRPVGSVTL